LATIHLIEGPVGSGKSTFAARLSNKLRAPRFILDEWMSTLFSPDRPASGVIEWYLERKNRCINQIWSQARKTMETGLDAILELGLIQRHDRTQFFKFLHNTNYNMIIYVLDATRDIRRTRVRNRNIEKGPTFCIEIPDQVFEMASDMWQPIDESECTGYEIRLIATD
jgi:predicted kinase